MTPTGKPYVFFSILNNRCYCTDEVFDIVRRRFEQSGHWYTETKPHKPGWRSILFANLGYQGKSELRHKFDDINYYFRPALEPDGATGYEYTIEAAHGVPVGCDWMPAPCRAIVVYRPPVVVTPPDRGSQLQFVISLFHPSMLCEVA